MNAGSFYVVCWSDIPFLWGLARFLWWIRLRSHILFREPLSLLYNYKLYEMIRYFVLLRKDYNMSLSLLAAPKYHVDDHQEA